MPMVIFYVQAYNAEKTIGRTLESLLLQTCPDWVCYCIDNGCTDKTAKIIERYAQIDGRIKMRRVKQNDPSYFFVCLPTILEQHPEEDFFTTLDADDEYTPDFVEKMLSFIQRNRLEIAACGNYFLDARSGNMTGERILKGDLIFSGALLSEYFPLYHQFMRTVWGKLYAISVLKKVNWGNMRLYMYGVDTLVCTECFRHASRIGVLAKSLHKYYVSPKSVSYQFDKKRIQSDRILHEAACAFLVEKCGYISPRNENFLLAVYMNASKDTLNVLLDARIPVQGKIEGVIDIVTHEYTGQLMAKDHFGLGAGSVTELSAQRKELFSTVLNWLLSLDEVPSELVEGYCGAGELLSATTENAEGWLFFKKLRVRFFLEQNRKDEARDSLFELAELIPNDTEVMDFQQSF